MVILHALKHERITNIPPLGFERISPLVQPIFRRHGSAAPNPISGRALLPQRPNFNYLSLAPPTKYLPHNHNRLAPPHLLFQTKIAL